MKKIKISYVEKRNTSANATWGVPWKKGERYSLNGLCGETMQAECFPLQSTVRAKWPDGSVKWSLHSAVLPVADSFYLSEQNVCAPSEVMCTERDSMIEVDTGVLKARLPKTGNSVIQSVCQNGKITCNAAKPILLLEERSTEAGVFVREYCGEIHKANVEENGGIRAVICFKGIHKAKNSLERFPFCVRLYFYRKSAEIRMVHTFLYDGSPQKDFIKGIGIRFGVPMEGEFYNRHVKLAGDTTGIFHEPLQLLTSWRNHISAEIYEKQLKGEAISFCATEENHLQTTEAIADVTLWDSFRLTQDSSEHFSISKRTRHQECSFINAMHGHRSAGLAYLGSMEHGLAVGIRDFWQKYPSCLSVEDASRDEASITAWMWPPHVEAADLRHYDTEAHASVYYEGFDEIRSTPYGTANTNELVLFSFDSIPQNEQLNRCTAYLHKPPVLVCSSEAMHAAGAFGVWSLPASSAKAAEFETWLNNAVDFYKGEIERRKWYGFFDYGDVMHTYDNNRHMWKYDMGGYAWQNTELVPTLWLWQMFLRSGRDDVLTLAEAMSRHCSEVDVYHIGEYKGLGSRHNVIHWGCACKEARIAMAFHHRYFYYITGDERLGDIFEEVKDAEYGVERLDPLRYFYQDGMKTHARTGPDWSSLCSNWLTRWERFADEKARDKILRGIKDIAKAPLQLASGSDFGFDPDTGEMIYIGENSAGGAHLALCMGAPTVWFELAECLDNSVQWRQMLADYGAFYLLSPEEKRAQSKGLVDGSGWPFPYMAAAMAAFSAKHTGNKMLAAKVWDILYEEMRQFEFEPVLLEHQPSVFVDSEQKSISTNFIAQWCLNTIMCLDLIGDML